MAPDEMPKSKEEQIITVKAALQPPVHHQLCSSTEHRKPAGRDWEAQTPDSLE